MMPERTTAANAATENAKPATKYTYDYAKLPPLAMAGALPEVEDFSARPDWIHLVARSALKIVINTIMIGVKNKRDNIDFVPEVLRELKAVADLLSADTKRDLSNAIAKELEKRGSPTKLPELKEFLGGVIESFAKTLTLETLVGFEQVLEKLATVSGPASSLEDYNQLFQFISLPAISQNFREDSEFAAMRVAGPNPLMIEQI